MRKKGLLRKLLAVALSASFCFGSVISAEAASGTWKSDSTGWWYSYSDGSYAKNSWQQIDGSWYYFDINGYMDCSGYRDGCWLNGDGSWNTAYSGGKWASNKTGWWYTDASGWYPVKTWLRIDGAYYYFKDTGYMATNEWIGDSYVGSDGAWVPNADDGLKHPLAEADPNAEVYSISKEYAREWQYLYYNKINELKTSGAKFGSSKQASPSYSYFIYDIDKDQTPELFVRFGTCEADYFFKMYGCESGKVVELAELGGGHTSYYSLPGTGILSVWGHMGDMFVAKLTYEGGKINSESLFSEHLDENHTEYTSIDTIAAGAVPLHEYSLRCALPIVSYYTGIPSTKASDTDKTESVINDVIDKNGSLYVSYVDYFVGGSQQPGKMSFNKFCKKGSVYDYSSLTIEKRIWGDLNADGQNECLLIFKTKTTSKIGMVLSYQGGRVYGYYLSYIDKSATISEGLIKENSSTSALTFYKDQVYINYEY